MKCKKKVIPINEKIVKTLPKKGIELKPIKKSKFKFNPVC
jgi:hypothetical protein